MKKKAMTPMEDLEHRFATKLAYVDGNFLALRLAVIMLYQTECLRYQQPLDRAAQLRGDLTTGIATLKWREGIEARDKPAYDLAEETARKQCVKLMDDVVEGLKRSIALLSSTPSRDSPH